MPDVTVTQVARNFADYLNRVAYRRESFRLVRGNKPVAELRPLPAAVRLSELPALLSTLPRLTAAEAADLGDDLATARAALGEARDPWQS